MWPSQVGDFNASDLQLPEKWRSRLNHPGFARTRACTSTAGMDGSNGDNHTNSHSYGTGAGRGGRGRTTDRGSSGELGSSEQRMNGRHQHQRQDPQQVPKRWSEGLARPIVDPALTELRSETSMDKARKVTRGRYEGSAVTHGVGRGRTTLLRRSGTVIGNVTRPSIDLEKRPTCSKDAGKADNGASSKASGGLNGGSSLSRPRGDVIINPGRDVGVDLEDSISHDAPRWSFRTVSHESKVESVEGVSCNGDRGKNVSPTGSSPDVSPSAAPQSRRQQMLKSRSSMYGSRHDEEGGSGMSTWSTNSPSPVLNIDNEVVDNARKEA